MIKPGQNLHVNGEEYQAVGAVQLYRKSGDSSTTVELHGIQKISDGSRFYVAALDGMGNQPEMFVEAPQLVPAADDWVATGDVKEWRVTDNAFGTVPAGQFRAQRSLGTRVGATETLPSPMAGAGTLITLAPADGSGPPNYLFGREIVTAVGERQHYTDDTPASGMPLNKLERVPVSPAVFRWISLVLVLVVAGLVALDLKAKVHPTFDYVKLYWYLGLGSIVALFVRRRYPFRIAFYMFAAAFLLYFQTLFIEYLLGVTQTTSSWNVEGFRIAGILTALVVLDLVHPKSFSMVAHATLFSGLISLFFYSCGFAIYACDGGAWSSYRQHVGGLPHGYIWLLVFLGFLIYRIRDYRLVPVKFEGAMALHRKMEKGFDAPVATVHKRATALSHMADDFSDAIMVSNDRRMSAAVNVYARYQLLSTLMKNFSKVQIDRVRDRELADQDLVTMREDLRNIREVFERDNPEEQFPAFRISPQIAAANRSGSRKV